MAATDTPTGEHAIDAQLHGLDALEFVVPTRRGLGSRVWSFVWPKCLAIGIFGLFWQIVVWSGWKPTYLLPAPGPVFQSLFDNFDTLVNAAGTTLGRAVQGFLMAVVIGTLLGAAVTRSRILRAGIGSMITGLQTMPSVAWFPLAILLFKLTEGAILFVVVLGAAPSIANGLIDGIDNTPPLLLRAGRVLGARGIAAFRHVILPAALPGFASGLKQGWAFAWRSLLAGELLVIIPGTHSLGEQLEFSNQFADSKGVISVMIVLLVVGVIVDELLFGTMNRTIRRRYGLVDQAAKS